MIENICHNGIKLAILIRANYCSDGIQFFTPDDYSQQLAYMRRELGYKIQPHIHKPVLREILYTSETLIIKSGSLRIDFYDFNKAFIMSRVLNAGDVILLIEGGHGFEMLEDTEIIEVKQGPYAGDNDKERFN